MPQPGVGVACLPSAVGRLSLRLVQYLQCQKETETERGARTAELSAQVICMGGQACRWYMASICSQVSVSIIGCGVCLIDVIVCQTHTHTHTHTRNNSLCKYCRVWKCIIYTSFLYRYIYKLVYRRYCWLWIAFQVFVKINKKCFRRLLTNCIICQSADKADTHTHARTASTLPSLNAMSTHDCTRIAHAKR